LLVGLAELAAKNAPCFVPILVKFASASRRKSELTVPAQGRQQRSLIELVERPGMLLSHFDESFARAMETQSKTLADTH
jgi:hypothetical protein